MNRSALYRVIAVVAAAALPFALASPIDEAINFYRAVSELAQNPSAFNNYFPRIQQLIPYIAIFFRLAHFPTTLTVIAKVLMIVAALVVAIRVFSGEENVRSAIVRALIAVTILALFSYSTDGTDALSTDYTPNPGSTASIDPQLIYYTKRLFLQYSIPTAEYFKAKAVAEMAAGAKPFYELLLYSTVAKWAASGVEGISRQLGEIGTGNPFTGIALGTVLNFAGGALADLRGAIDGFARMVRLFYFGTPVVLLTVYTVTVFLAAAALYLLFYSIPLLAPLILATPGGLATASRVARYMLVLILIPVIAGVSIWFSSWLIYNFTRGSAEAARKYMEAGRKLLPVATFNRYVEPQWEVFKLQLANLAECAAKVRERRRAFQLTGDPNELTPLAQIKTERNALCYGTQSLLMRSAGLAAATPEEVALKRSVAFAPGGEPNTFGLSAANKSLLVLEKASGSALFETYSAYIKENLTRSLPEYILSPAHKVRLIPNPSSSAELNYLKTGAGKRTSGPLAGCYQAGSTYLGLYCLSDTELEALARTYANAEGMSNRELAKLVMANRIANVSGDLKLISLAAATGPSPSNEVFRKVLQNLEAYRQDAINALLKAGFKTSIPQIANEPPDPDIKKIWPKAVTNQDLALAQGYIDAIRSIPLKSGQLYYLAGSSPDFVTIYAAYYPIVQKAMDLSTTAAASAVASYYFYVIVAGILAALLVITLPIVLVRVINFVFDTGASIVSGGASMGAVGAAGAGVLAGGSAGGGSTAMRYRPTRPAPERGGATSGGGMAASGGSAAPSAAGAGSVYYYTAGKPAPPPPSASQFGFKTNRPAPGGMSGKTASDFLD